MPTHVPKGRDLGSDPTPSSPLSQLPSFPTLRGGHAGTTGIRGHLPQHIWGSEPNTASPKDSILNSLHNPEGHGEGVTWAEWTWSTFTEQRIRGGPWGSSLLASSSSCPLPLCSCETESSQRGAGQSWCRRRESPQDRGIRRGTCSLGSWIPSLLRDVGSPIQSKDKTAPLPTLWGKNSLCLRKLPIRWRRYHPYSGNFPIRWRKHGFHMNWGQDRHRTQGNYRTSESLRAPANGMHEGQEGSQEVFGLSKLTNGQE